jgi:hypothetical protein
MHDMSSLLIRDQNLSWRVTADRSFRPRGHWKGHLEHKLKYIWFQRLVSQSVGHLTRSNSTFLPTA